MKAQPIKCRRCGQMSNERPGMKLVEPMAEAVFISNGHTDELVLLNPQLLVCNTCDFRWPVERDSVEVRKP